MIEDTLTRNRIGNVEVIPLAELVDALHNQHIADLPELNDPNVKSILVDAETFPNDVYRSDPVAVIVRYTKLAQAAGKKVIVFNIGREAEEAITSSKAGIVLERRGMYYTQRDLSETLREYC